MDNLPPGLMPLDLVTCELATTGLTLPWFVPAPAVLLLSKGFTTLTLLYRQQAEIYGQGNHLTEAHRHILN